MSSSILDRSTTLCLACSSSLPPLKGTASSSSANSIHTTNCCQRPICPACISSNPRLARYNPCLACLGGVDVVSAYSGRTFLSNKKEKTPVSPNFGSNSNLDGSLRDQDTFVLGDDEDEDDILGAYDRTIRDGDAGAPPPPYAPLSEPPGGTVGSPPASQDVLEPPSCNFTAEPIPNTVQTSQVVTKLSANSTSATPYKYYLNREDTLQGLALRFGLDVRMVNDRINWFVKLIAFRFEGT